MDIQLVTLNLGGTFEHCVKVQFGGVRSRLQWPNIKENSTMFRSRVFQLLYLQLKRPESCSRSPEHGNEIT